jgi:hypothetical protein
VRRDPTLAFAVLEETVQIMHDHRNMRDNSIFDIIEALNELAMETICQNPELMIGDVDGSNPGCGVLSLKALRKVLSSFRISAHEVFLFRALLRWAGQRERQGEALEAMRAKELVDLLDLSRIPPSVLCWEVRGGGLDCANRSCAG